MGYGRVHMSSICFAPSGNIACQASQCKEIHLQILHEGPVPRCSICFMWRVWSHLAYCHGSAACSDVIVKSLQKYIFFYINTYFSLSPHPDDCGFHPPPFLLLPADVSSRAENEADCITAGETWSFLASSRNSIILCILLPHDTGR